MLGVAVLVVRSLEQSLFLSLVVAIVTVLSAVQAIQHVSKRWTASQLLVLLITYKQTDL